VNFARHLKHPAFEDRMHRTQRAKIPSNAVKIIYFQGIEILVGERHSEREASALYKIEEIKTPSYHTAKLFRSSICIPDHLRSITRTSINPCPKQRREITHNGQSMQYCSHTQAPISMVFSYKHGYWPFRTCSGRQ